VAWYHKKGLDPYDSYMEPPIKVKLTLPFKKTKITYVNGKEETKNTKNKIITLTLSDTPVYIEESK